MTAQRPIDDRAEIIDAAMKSAIDDSLRDGPWAEEIVHQLRKRSLMIVEYSHYGRVLTTLQLVVSVLEPFVTDMGASAFPPGVWRALLGMVTKIKEL